MPAYKANFVRLVLLSPLFTFIVKNNQKNKTKLQLIKYKGNRVKHQSYLVVTGHNIT